MFVSSLKLLRAAVGAERVVTDPDVVVGFSRDWTGRFGAKPLAVVRAASVDQVAAVLEWCTRTGTAVVPQGGNTGLVGGGVPRGGELVLSLAGLVDPLTVDVAAAQVTAGAGVTLGRLQQAASDAGLVYGVDVASRESATVGGSIATNAGGLRVPRYGDTRAQVVGVEAVMGDGTVVSHLNGLTRDNTGYHLPSLLTGSEGTLAVITKARLRLHRPSQASAVALVGFDSLHAAVTAAGLLRTGLPGVVAVELMLPAGMGLVLRHTGLAAPIGVDRVQAYLVVECDDTDPVSTLSHALSQTPGVCDAAVADDTRGRAALWAFRERHTEAIASRGAAVKMDVTLPAATLSEFLHTVQGTVGQASPGAATWLFGHVGDGNVHVNVTEADDPDMVQDSVYRLVAAMGGSISTEHGIGVAKKRWLHLNRSNQELRVFASIKAALDPGDVLNPGVLFP
jgi:FAD/FMN-containing dehydrogenase